MLNVNKYFILVAIWLIAAAIIVNIWAAIMPQVWGSIPVHTSIPGAAVIVTVLTITTLLTISLLTPAFRQLRWTLLVFQVLAMTALLFFVAKLLSSHEETKTVQTGAEINLFIASFSSTNSTIPSREAILQKFPDLKGINFDISPAADQNGWILNFRSKVLLWWGISDPSKDSWFYLID